MVFWMFRVFRNGPVWRIVIQSWRGRHPGLHAIFDLGELIWPGQGVSAVSVGERSNLAVDRGPLVPVAGTRQWMATTLPAIAPSGEVACDLHRPVSPRLMQRM